MGSLSTTRIDKHREQQAAKQRRKQQPRAVAQQGGGAVVLYEPLEIQRAPLEAPHRFKLIRAGRRGGKSRFALYAAIMGHGPIGTDGDPLWKGVAAGRPIVWLAPDIPQAKSIWEEEILPRFEGKDGVRIDKGQHMVRIGTGYLKIVSFENVRSIRGKKLGGIICDEAAHWDLEHAWKDIIRPALVDLKGWAIFPSTPNFGRDYAQNEERKYGPSFFNVLCKDFREGKLTEDWGHFHWTQFDNPKLPPEERQSVLNDYKDSPAAYDQEILAKLLEGIQGVFFGEFSETVHVRAVQIPDDAWWGAGLDWGYSSPGYLAIQAEWTGSYGERKHLRAELEFRKLTPFEAGEACGKVLLKYQKPEYIAADSSMWDTGDGRGGNVEPIWEPFQRGLDKACGVDRNGVSRAPQLIPAPKGPGSREVRALEIRSQLAHKVTPYTDSEPVNPVKGRKVAGGIVQPWHEPKLSIDPSCKHYIRCIETLPTDPLDVELPATKDVYDHPHDGKSYLDVQRKAGDSPKLKSPRQEGRSYDRQKFKVLTRNEGEDYEPQRRFYGRRGEVE